MSQKLAQLTSWHSEWANLRVAVLGFAQTGFSVADTLAELGAHVVVCAREYDKQHVLLAEVIGVTLVTDDSQHGVPKKLVDFQPELIVVSPGFSPQNPLVVWAKSAGIPMWSDIELAWRLRDKLGKPAEWITVTGTNGKTSTVQLASTMLAEQGYRVAPCGNIGVPILDAIRDPQGFDVFVVELSSYQLHTTFSVSAHASVCLNLADDHLDWHGSFEAYAAAKAKIYHNTRIACVYNRADIRTRTMVEQAEVIEGARAISFGLDSPGMSDFGVVDGVLCDRAFVEERRTTAEEITTLDELRERGLAAPHMVENILAASALVRSFGVSLEAVSRALDGFQPDRHRIEQVARVDGIEWVNDSKATNPHAAHAALSAYDSIVWILGGLFKGAEIENLIRSHRERLRGVVVIGTERSQVRQAFQRHAPELPFFEVNEAETRNVMPVAVRLAAALAQPQDVILLAPAAASMDQFDDYADRGTKFSSAVRDFLGGEAAVKNGPTLPGSSPTSDATG